VQFPAIVFPDYLMNVLSACLLGGIFALIVLSAFKIEKVVVSINERMNSGLVGKYVVGHGKNIYAIGNDDGNRKVQILARFRTHQEARLFVLRLLTEELEELDRSYLIGFKAMSSELRRTEIKNRRMRIKCALKHFNSMGSRRDYSH
jgi:hypothetical protein